MSRQFGSSARRSARYSGIRSLWRPLPRVLARTMGIPIRSEMTARCSVRFSYRPMKSTSGRSLLHVAVVVARKAVVAEGQETGLQDAQFEPFLETERTSGHPFGDALVERFLGLCRVGPVARYDLVPGVPLDRELEIVLEPLPPDSGADFLGGEVPLEAGIVPPRAVPGRCDDVIASAIGGDRCSEASAGGASEMDEDEPVFMGNDHGGELREDRRP